MVPASFDESNCVMSPPEGVGCDQVQVVSVCRTNLDDGTPVVISCWKLTADELAEINRTGRVWLTVMGRAMQPVHLTSINPFKVGDGR